MVEVVDPVADYAQLMEQLFDFERIRDLLTSDTFRMRFDGNERDYRTLRPRHSRATSGRARWQRTARQPMPDFGGEHPDPNLAHAS